MNIVPPGLNFSGSSPTRDASHFKNCTAKDLTLSGDSLCSFFVVFTEIIFMRTVNRDTELWDAEGGVCLILFLIQQTQTGKWWLTMRHCGVRKMWKRERGRQEDVVAQACWELQDRSQVKWTVLGSVFTLSLTPSGSSTFNIKKNKNNTLQENG